MIAAVARCAAAVAVLVAGYAVLPEAGRPATRWAAGVALVVLVVGWQVRAVSRSRHPVRRGVTALVLVASVFVLVCADTYVLLSTVDGGAFSERLDRLSAAYFAVTVFATVGFGDVVPLTGVARLAVTAQMCGDVLLVGGVARLVVEAVRVRRREVGRHDG
ncbi:potassium channel family protein [Actinosynnema sp. NPDC020468]|uniref:potassium channel family protein n=1 Tax=Actinosynnema sp. NPDC020468 TaxID=3154488 RepID=UPI0033FAC638